MLFPSDYKEFHCSFSYDGKVATIGIRLDAICTVTRSLLGFITQTVECQKTIYAKISKDHVYDIRGVKVYTKVPVINTMVVSEVIVENYFTFLKTFQFKSSTGELSPPFPAYLFPDKAPKCDSKVTIEFDNNGMLNGVEEKKEEIVSSNDAGRPFILPVA